MAQAASIESSLLQFVGVRSEFIGLAASVALGVCWPLPLFELRMLHFCGQNGRYAI